MIPKFRAWDKVSETMHKVEGIHFGINGARVISLAETNRYNNNHKRWHTDIELLQSTGLFDKNGKEIYEGDILKYSDEYRVVEMYDGAWIARAGEKRLIVKMAVLSGAEIIGNKFENPHLLEED